MNKPQAQTCGPLETEKSTRNQHEINMTQQSDCATA